MKGRFFKGVIMEDGLVVLPLDMMKMENKRRKLFMAITEQSDISSPSVWLSISS